MNLWTYILISSSLLLMLPYTLDPLPLSCANAHEDVHPPITNLCKLFRYCPCLCCYACLFTALYIGLSVSLFIWAHACVVPHFFPWSICVNMFAIPLLPILLSMAIYMNDPCLKLPTIHEVLDFAWHYLCHMCRGMDIISVDCMATLHWNYMCVHDQAC